MGTLLYLVVSSLSKEEEEEEEEVKSLVLYRKGKTHTNDKDYTLLGGGGFVSMRGFVFLLCCVSCILS
jgi:hypothetical protein